jgi:hypothetical protein
MVSWIKEDKKERELYKTAHHKNKTQQILEFFSKCK